jgi:RNA polymerase sigma-70 factor, ECF subfamily
VLFLVTHALSSASNPEAWKSRMTESPPDEALVERATQGDAIAFAALVRLHAPSAFRVALRLTGNAADAEEVTQDAFARVHAKLGEFRRESKFSTWLFRIVTNAALMQRRSSRARRHEPLDAFLPAFDEAGFHARLDLDCSLPGLPDSETERRELRTELESALERLPDGYREAFILRDLEELSSDEVGRVLNLEPAAVRQRVHRARLMLRGLLVHTLGADR